MAKQKKCLAVYLNYFRKSVFSFYIKVKHKTVQIVKSSAQHIETLTIWIWTMYHFTLVLKLLFIRKDQIGSRIEII